MPPLPRSGLLPDAHAVPDVLAPGLRLVFCGTALGRRSAEQRAYYAHPNNLFWRTLHETGLTPERIAPSDYAGLLAHGIGLTDLAKRHFGNDAELPGDAFDVAALRGKIMRYQPAMLAFTSKTGASAFLDRPTGRIALGLQPEMIGATRLFVLPSPSGTARSYWNKAVWEALAAEVRAMN
jgi:TDG/mug DNA glycosylase family protein